MVNSVPDAALGFGLAGIVHDVLDGAALVEAAQVHLAVVALHGLCIHVYVIADDFAQSGEYNLYRVTFNDSQTSDLEPIAEGIEDLFIRTDDAKKVLMDGQLFIRHGNNWYNAAGIRVK